MGFEERQELPRIALVGFARCRALPALHDEMIEPRHDDALEVIAERQLGIRGQNTRRAIAPKAFPMPGSAASFRPLPAFG